MPAPHLFLPWDGMRQHRLVTGRLGAGIYFDMGLIGHIVERNGMGMEHIPMEMRVKLNRILEMELDELNDAYIKKMLALGRPIVNGNQPALDEMYRVLIPELFDLAEKVKNQKLN